MEPNLPPCLLLFSPLCNLLVSSLKAIAWRQMICLLACFLTTTCTCCKTSAEQLRTQKATHHSLRADCIQSPAMVDARPSGKLEHLQLRYVTTKQHSLSVYLLWHLWHSHGTAVVACQVTSRRSLFRVHKTQQMCATSSVKDPRAA